MIKSVRNCEELIENIDGVIIGAGGDGAFDRPGKQLFCGTYPKRYHGERAEIHL
jgi:hypothetical protein